MNNIFYIGQLDKLPFLLILGAKINISLFFMTSTYLSIPARKSDRPGPYF